MLALLRPTIWLSSQLSFARKYLLVCAVALLALAGLSLPLLQQSRLHIAETEHRRAGLSIYLQQTDVLMQLVQLRYAALDGAFDPEQVTQVQAQLEHLLAISYSDPQHGFAPRLQAAKLQLSGLKHGLDLHSRQHNFKIASKAISLLLGLIRENARHYLLITDVELSAALEMLTHRLPLVADTLGRQRDATGLDNESMVFYALSSQMVLNESVVGVRLKVAHLIAIHPDGAQLTAYIEPLLIGLDLQQGVTNDLVAKTEATLELYNLTKYNLQNVERLLTATARSVDDIFVARIHDYQRNQWLVLLVLLGTISALIYLFVGFYWSTQSSLRRLARGTQEFCSGRLDTHIQIDTKDELLQVASNFNTIATQFKSLLDVIRQQNESKQLELETMVQARTAELALSNAALQAVNARVQEELMLAHDMQKAILPQHFPHGPGIEVYAAMHTARELGGDFYECCALPDGRYGILVADVSGKGVAAAFFMAVSRTTILDLALSGDSPATVLAHANDSLCLHNPLDLFVTVFYAIYDPASGRLEYANAGHPPALLRAPDGSVQELPGSCDLALGYMSAVNYQEHSVVLELGATLLLYSDGVTEANSPTGQFFGLERLLKWLSKIPEQQPVAASVNDLVFHLNAFAEGAEAADDLTCLILKRTHGGA